jgi:hypothetical protein
VKFTTHLHLVSKLRISGRIPPLAYVCLHGVSRKNLFFKLFLLIVSFYAKIYEKVENVLFVRGYFNNNVNGAF